MLCVKLYEISIWKNLEERNKFSARDCLKFPIAEIPAGQVQAQFC